MNKTSLLPAFAALAILSGNVNASIIPVAAGSLTDCPSVGFAGTCAIEYRFNADGSVDTLVDNTVPSTDNIEDTLVGILNNSGHTLDSLVLLGNGLSIFGFEGDGQSPIPNPGVGPGDTYFGQYFDAVNALLGTVTFSNISSVIGTNDKGNVDFAGLTTGGHGWWVLEEQVDFTKPPTVGTVPEPTSIALLSFGLAGLGVARRRKV